MLRNAGLVLVLVLCLGFQSFASSLQPKLFWVYQDSTKALSLQEVMANAGFYPRSNLNFGYSASSVWVKMPLKSPKVLANTRVMLTHSALYYVDFFLVQNDSVFLEKHTGLKRELASRGQWTNKFYMDLPGELSPGAELYIRLYNQESALKTDIQLVHPPTQVLSLLSDLLFFAGLAGLVLVLVLYNLLSFVKFPKTIFLYYAAYIICLLFYMGANMGLFHLLLPNVLIPYTSIVRVFWSIPALGFFLLFVYRLLDLGSLSGSFLSKAYLVSQVLLLLFLAVLFVPKQGVWITIAASAYYFFYSLLAVLLVYSGIVSFRQGHKPAYYFLVGQVPLMVVFVLVVLRNYQILPFLPLMNYLPESLFLLELLVTFPCLELHIKSEKRIEALVSNQVSQEALVNSYSVTLKQANESIDEEVQEHFNSLVAYVQKHKPYLMPELKIADLAMELQISSHQLSKAINTCSGMHFFDFINSYRVEYAKTRMNEPGALKKFTIETIARESGFNNKTSFNASFKKFTGKTPSEYKQQLLE
ncbi:MAG: helix-turn-helix domain-containing protein [Bacteroidia bacterium]|nr:helix-turn-helix domain-containing protein [Bacteroidia bacterium]